MHRSLALQSRWPEGAQSPEECEEFSAGQVMAHTWLWSRQGEDMLTVIFLMTLGFICVCLKQIDARILQGAPTAEPEQVFLLVHCLLVYGLESGIFQPWSQGT